MLSNKLTIRLDPPSGYRIQDNKLGLTASLLAGRAAKCLLPPRPPLKGWAVKVLGCPQAAGHPTENRDLTSQYVLCGTSPQLNCTQYQF